MSALFNLGVFIGGSVVGHSNGVLGRINIAILKKGFYAMSTSLSGYLQNINVADVVFDVKPKIAKKVHMKSMQSYLEIQEGLISLPRTVH